MLSHIKAFAATAAAFSLALNPMLAQSNASIVGPSGIRHVLLISIDGMHSVDFANCRNGMPGANGGPPFCPNLAALGQMGITYRNTTTSKPSDSFPG